MLDGRLGFLLDIYRSTNRRKLTNQFSNNYEVRLFVVCPPAPSVVNAWTDVYMNLNSVVAVFTCFVGFYFVDGGTSRSTMCVDFTWSQSLPGCEGILSCLPGRLPGRRVSQDVKVYCHVYGLVAESPRM